MQVLAPIIAQVSQRLVSAPPLHFDLDRTLLQVVG
jgi:hypothetical protein